MERKLHSRADNRGRVNLMDTGYSSRNPTSHGNRPSKSPVTNEDLVDINVPHDSTMNNTLGFRELGRFSEFQSIPEVASMHDHFPGVSQGEQF